MLKNGGAENDLKSSWWWQTQAQGGPKILIAVNIIP